MKTLYFVADKTDREPNQNNSMIESLELATKECKRLLALNIYSWIIEIKIENPYFLGDHPAMGNIYSMDKTSKIIESKDL